MPAAMNFPRAVQNLIQIHGGGRDGKIRQLILRLHNYSQARPDAAGWLAQQRKLFSAVEPADWQRWLLAAIAAWRDEWLPVLAKLNNENTKAAELAVILQRLTHGFSRELAAEILAQILATDGKENFPKGKLGVLREPLEDLFDEAAFLASVTIVQNGGDPLAEDWRWVCGHMETLLRLAEEFAEQFSRRKLADGALDFHDLEQFALKLLWDFAAGRPTAVGEHWRKKLRFVFVDEYQDINAAQDKIIAALSRTGAGANRFLVGDVKQSIYRFRLADPKIFRDYARDWHGEDGRVVPLAENFRSREGLLAFVNSVFPPLMRAEFGGVDYNAEAALKFGSPQTRADFGAAHDSVPRVELLVRFKRSGKDSREDEESELADLGAAQKEARLIASQLKQIEGKLEIWSEPEKAFRPARFRDMAILLRSPRGKAEMFAQEFVFRRTWFESGCPHHSW